MSRQLELPEGSPSNQGDRVYTHPFISVVTHYASSAKSLHNLHHSTAGSHSSYNSHRVNNENGLYSNQSYGTKSLIPLPDWPVALSTWGVSWDIHIYGFSGLYLMLTMVSVAIFLRFRLRVQRFKIVYNTLILLATSGIFRAVFMLVDPYGYQDRMAGLMVGIMTQAVYPLFCACYGLTQVMLLRITNVDVGHSRLRTLSCLLGCTLTYLFVVVVIETLVFYQRSLKLLLLLDSGCFIVWSLCLGVTFICSGFRLTQYVTETKKAHKELNTFCSHRRSASNTTGLSASSNITYNINTLNADVSSPTSDTLKLSNSASATSDALLAETSVQNSSQPFATSGSVCPALGHRSNTHVRLSRPRLKISDTNHMTVTIATDDDDESTSSTDVEKPRNEQAPRRVRRVRKCAKQKHAHFRSRSRSKTRTSSSVYRAVSVTDETHSPKTFLPRSRNETKSSDTDDENAYNPISDNRASLSAIESHDSQNAPSPKPSESLLSNICVIESQRNMSKRTSTKSSELPLLASSLLQETQDSSTFDTNETLNDDPEDENVENSHKEMSHLATCCRQSSKYIPEDSLSPTSSFGAGTNHLLNWKHKRDSVDSPLYINEHLCENHLESTMFSVPIDNDQMCNSPRENGYLADTENIFSCSAFSRLSNSLRRQPKLRDEIGHASCDVSSQRSSSSHSDDDSTTSPGLPERMTPNMSASLGLFRIRQSKVIQRAVHLTYFLTFLFMFACLLQLYTVFGVYGVLGTIPRPDPWPWLIFHTIFRATEVSIGLTVAAIAFITLNYRYQRAKRRHQQQQHLVATRDCIV